MAGTKGTYPKRRIGLNSKNSKDRDIKTAVFLQIRLFQSILMKKLFLNRHGITGT